MYWSKEMPDKNVQLWLKLVFEFCLELKLLFCEIFREKF